uniref:Uncharacterized protein n=1 Tax=Canis lupus dingo TaxID=286419 RepID=A0A8C0JME0_CANLU
MVSLVCTVPTLDLYSLPVQFSRASENSYSQDSVCPENDIGNALGMKEYIVPPKQNISH